ncbi:MAG: FixH family protein [Psychrobacter sp.]|nr:FixH family protein [Psychrobacter sp.]
MSLFSKPASTPAPKTPTSKPTDFKQQDTQPWYKNYMVMVFVIGMPAFVVIACLGLVYYSFVIKDSVVRDDWYMDGKTLYQDVSRDKLAHDLGLHGKMQFAEDGQVTFYLNYPSQSLTTGKLLNGAALTYPDKLKLSISHATDIKKDRDTVLIHQKDNLYSAKVQIDPTPAKYYLEVSNDGTLNWRLRDVAKLPRADVTFIPLKTFDVE